MNTLATRHVAIGIMVSVSMMLFSGCSEKEADKVATPPATKEKVTTVTTAPANEPVQEAPKAPAPVAKPAPRSTAAPTKSTVAATPAPVEKPVCANCGVVVSVMKVEQEGDGSGLGAVAGGIVGGVAGHQVGSGTGKDLATAVGAIGGAVIGHKIEKNVKKKVFFDVTVKMESGEERVLRHEADPQVAAGDKIKVENNLVVKQ